MQVSISLALLQTGLDCTGSVSCCSDVCHHVAVVMKVGGEHEESGEALNRRGVD